MYAFFFSLYWTNATVLQGYGLVPGILYMHSRGQDGGVPEQYDRLIEGSRLVLSGLWRQFPSGAKRF